MQHYFSFCKAFGGYTYIHTYTQAAIFTMMCERCTSSDQLLQFKNKTKNKKKINHRVESNCISLCDCYNTASTNNSTNSFTIPAIIIYFILYCTFIHYGTIHCPKNKIIQTHTVISITQKKKKTEYQNYIFITHL